MPIQPFSRFSPPHNWNTQYRNVCSCHHGSRNANELDIGINSNQIKSGSDKLNISYQKPNYVYKFDFGNGSTFSHSPVESGYFMVTEQDPETFGLWWYDANSNYRIPIKISNPTSETFTDTVIRIVLNKNNFNYDFADVTIYSSTSDSHKVDSNLIFVDSLNNIIDYFVDHWNPNGESIILLKMDINPTSNEEIFRLISKKFLVKIVQNEVTIGKLRFISKQKSILTINPNVSIPPAVLVGSLLPLLSKISY